MHITIVSKSVANALQLRGQTDVYVPSTMSRCFGAETKIVILVDSREIICLQ